MKISPRQTLALALLSLSIAVSLALPKKHQQDSSIITELKIPFSMVKWYGTDISCALDIRDSKYNFINRVLARIYKNEDGRKVTFLILDAGNFHNPKVCFGASGYKIRELQDVEIKTPLRSFNASALYLYKEGGKGNLLIYWICINGKQVNWVGQKMKQLYYSLLNKDKAALMVRMDIPAKEGEIEKSIELAQDFISSISGQINPRDAAYVFGQPQ